MFDSNSYALHYINYFLIFFVFILQYHPDKNVRQNRQKQATIIFQVFTNHLGELMIETTQYQCQSQRSNKSQYSQNLCPPTQESNVSSHYGAGYNESDYNFYNYWKYFAKGTEGFYDPDYLKKKQKKEEKVTKIVLKRI